jgi:hypothetical protein
MSGVQGRLPQGDEATEADARGLNGYAPAPAPDHAAFRALAERWEAENNDNDTAYNAGWDAAYHECARELLALCAPRSEPRWMGAALGVIVAWAKSRDGVPAEVDEAIEALRDALPCDAFAALKGEA